MILVTGGAGYIGSHVAKELLFSGNDVVILDNLCTGYKETVDTLEEIVRSKDDAGRLKYVYGDTGDKEIVTSILRDNKVSAVIHLAAFSQVGESMQSPGKYFENNVSRAMNLLECMANCKVQNIVFSSTAAVYGEPTEIPITEKHTTIPTNVYGASKLMVEQILKWYDKIHNIKHVSLRYFNAAGSDESGLIGERHDPETHLIPIIMQKALGVREKLMVFGDDYTTPDGTCIRDYIHVTDLANAHILALKHLYNGGNSKIYNLGNGNGYSVKEVIDTVSAVVGHEVAYEIGLRRAGDPAVLVASSELIKQDLGWKPKYPRLQDIVETAWRWHRG